MELILQTEKGALKFRLAVVLLAAVGLYLAALEAWLLAVLLALVYLGYVVVLRALLLPRLPFPWIVYGMIVVDVAAVSLGLLIGGQIGSPLFVLLPVLILYYSIHLGYASSLAAATVASLAYPAVALLTGEAGWLGAFLSFQVPLFYLLALMGGFIAEKRLEERREKESLQGAIGLERRARSLLEVTRALSSALEMEAVLDRVLGSAMTLAGVEAVVVALHQKTDRRLVVRAASVRPEDMRVKAFGEATEAPKKGSPISLALEALTPQYVTDLEREGRAPTWLKSLGYRSLLVAPLVHQGQALGVLYLLGNVISPKAMEEAGSLGDLAGIALFNATLYEESQARVAHLKEEFEELVGRVERRRQSQRKGAIQVNDLQVDLAKSAVTVEGRAVTLSPMEFDLLSVLAESAGEPLTHDTLLRLVWGPQYGGQANVVDVSIHRLRHKIEEDPSHPKRIITVRGIGYMLSTAPSDSPRR